MRQRVEEAVDIIVRHGFASTEQQAAAHVAVAANVAAANAVSPADNISTVGGVTANNMDTNAVLGSAAGSIPPSVSSGIGSGVGLSPADHSLLPDMDVFNLSGGLVGNKLKKDEDPPPNQEEPDDNAPIFYRYNTVYIIFN